MVNLSDCFSMIGVDGCMDVASSLGMQGVDKSMAETSIPIYGPFSLKILLNQDCGFICDSIPEFAAINQLNHNCGTVAVTLNLLQIDTLTLAGLLLSFTPNTGMNCFVKIAALDLASMSVEMLVNIANSMGIPVPQGLVAGTENVLGFAEDIMQCVFDKMIDILNNDLLSNNINIREWDELPDFYNNVKETGEMNEMLSYRTQCNAFLF